MHNNLQIAIAFTIWAVLTYLTIAQDSPSAASSVTPEALTPTVGTCSQAPLVVLNPFIPTIIIGSTTGLAFDPTAPNCPGVVNAGSAAFFTVLGTGGFIEVDTCSGTTNFDTTLSVLCGSPSACSQATCISFSNQGCGAGQLGSRVRFCSVNLQPYIIRVGAPFAGVSGSFTLRIRSLAGTCTSTCPETCPTAIVAPPPVAVSCSVNVANNLTLTGFPTIESGTTLTFSDTRLVGTGVSQCPNCFVISRRFTASRACRSTSTAVQLISVQDIRAPKLRAGFERVDTAAAALSTTTNNNAAKTNTGANTVTNTGASALNKLASSTLKNVANMGSIGGVSLGTLASLAGINNLGASSSLANQVTTLVRQGTFKIVCSATDNCDPNPTLKAWLILRDEEFSTSGSKVECISTQRTVEVNCGDVIEALIDERSKCDARRTNPFGLNMGSNPFGGLSGSPLSGLTGNAGSSSSSSSQYNIGNYPDVFYSFTSGDTGDTQKFDAQAVFLKVQAIDSCNNVAEVVIRLDPNRAQNFADNYSGASNSNPGNTGSSSSSSTTIIYT